MTVWEAVGKTLLVLIIGLTAPGALLFVAYFIYVIRELIRWRKEERR